MAALAASADRLAEPLSGRRYTRPLSQAHPVVELADSDAESSVQSDRSGSDDEIDRGLDRAQALNQFSKRQKLVADRSAAGDSRPVTPAATFVRVGHATAALTEKRGWVEKASPSWFAGWQRRWLVLKDKTLKWYKTADEEAAQGTIDFDLVECEVEQLWSTGESGETRRRNGNCWTGRGGKCSISEALLGSGSSVTFRICATGSNLAIELRVEDAMEGKAWVDAMEEHLRRADVAGQHDAAALQNFGQKKGAWWKVHRISPESFSKLAQTGDVLLFRSKGTFPRLIRAASGHGRFDHVALVLRLEGDALGLLESTGNEGVGLCTWEEFVQNGWEELYPELALRRTFFPRSEETLVKLQEWCSQVIGKPYSLTISKLAQRSSVSAGGDDQTSDFFCSQLVAEALKVLGVIPRGLSSTQFWPSTFSAKHRPPIKCSPQCSFSDTDLTIDFSLGDTEERRRLQLGAGQRQGRDATTNWG